MAARPSDNGSDGSKRWLACPEQAHTTPLGGFRGGRGRRRGLSTLAGEPRGQREHVFAHLAVLVANDEWHTPIHGQDERATVGNDRVRDLAAEARLHVARLDAA